MNDHVTYFLYPDGSVDAIRLIDSAPSTAQSVANTCGARYWWCLATDGRNWHVYSRAAFGSVRTLPTEAAAEMLARTLAGVM